MSVIIPNMKMPMSCLTCPLAREMFGCLVCVGYFKDSLTGRRVYKSDLKESDADFNRPDWCPILPLPEGHGDLVERKALNLFPDYKDVRNRIKQTIKATERDGRNITGVTIDLLKQTLVALDSLHSVRRYFLNAKTIVPAEGGTDNGN